jgi:hypothetical protein
MHNTNDVIQPPFWSNFAARRTNSVQTGPQLIIGELIKKKQFNEDLTLH